MHIIVLLCQHVTLYTNISMLGGDSLIVSITQKDISDKPAIRATITSAKLDDLMVRGLDDLLTRPPHSTKTHAYHIDDTSHVDNGASRARQGDRYSRNRTLVVFTVVYSQLNHSSIILNIGGLHTRS